MPTTQTRRRGRPRGEQGRFEGRENWQGQGGYQEEQWEPVPEGRRGFASWASEERRDVGPRGGRSRGGEGYEEDYDQPRSRRQYEEGDYEPISRQRGTSRRGFAAMDPERQRQIASEGGRAPHRGPRGFAAMDNREQREIASEGGRAPHRGPRGFAALREDELRAIASRGGRAPHRGPRGFAAMDPEEQREIAARGGHASRGGWGGDYREENYAPTGRSRGGTRRGLATMEPAPRRRITSRTGRSRRGN